MTTVMTTFAAAVVLAVLAAPFLWPAVYTVVRYWADWRADHREP